MVARGWVVWVVAVFGLTIGLAAPTGADINPSVILVSGGQGAGGYGPGNGDGNDHQGPADGNGNGARWGDGLNIGALPGGYQILAGRGNGAGRGSDAGGPAGAGDGASAGRGSQAGHGLGDGTGQSGHGPGDGTGNTDGGPADGTGNGPGIGECPAPDDDLET